MKQPALYVVDIIAGGQRIDRVRISSLPCTIGRAFDNDIIIDHDTVDAHHAVLEAVDASTSTTAVMLRDTGSVNGLCLDDGKRTRMAAIPVNNDAVVTVFAGAVEIRIYPAALPVAPAVAVVGGAAGYDGLLRWPVAATAFLLALGVTVYTIYLQVWGEDTPKAMAVAGVGVAAVILAWAGFWALVGRLLRQESRLTAQVAIASLYVLVSSVCFAAQSAAAFLFNGNMVSKIIDGSLNALALMPLMYVTLAFATKLDRRARGFAAVVFAGSIVCGGILFDRVGEPAFNPAPQFAAVLKPYGARLAPALDTRAFIDETARLADKTWPQSSKTE